MGQESQDSERIEEDADRIEQNYGTDAQLYVETRAEAADKIGDDPARRHWEQVAAALDEDPER